MVTSFSVQMNLVNLIFIPVAYSDLSDMDSCCGYDTEDESKVIPSPPPLVTQFGGGRQNVTVQYFFVSPPPPF